MIWMVDSDDEIWLRDETKSYAGYGYVTENRCHWRRDPKRTERWIGVMLCSVSRVMYFPTVEAAKLAVEMML